MPPQAPSASPRFSGGTAALSSVSVSGITIARVHDDISYIRPPGTSAS